MAGHPDSPGKPVIAVDNLTAKISEIAARFYGRPSETLSVFGITGTNGKSRSQFIAQILRAVGQNCGVMGTLGYGPFDNLLATELTTPDAVFTQKALAEMSPEAWILWPWRCRQLGCIKNGWQGQFQDSNIYQSFP